MVVNVLRCHLVCEVDNDFILSLCSCGSCSNVCLAMCFDDIFQLLYLEMVISGSMLL